MAERLQIVRASEVTPEPIQWVWRGRIPRKAITVVAGRPDSRKGLFCCHIIADITRAGGRVLYSTIEESYGIMTRPRLDAAGADLERVTLTQFILPVHLKHLAALLKKEPYDLVIMDPFAAHLTGGVRRHSDNIREVLTPLKQIIDQTDTAVLIVEHVIKKIASGAHPMQAIGGSGSGLVAACRMAYLFGADPEDDGRSHLVCVDHNVSDEPRALTFELDLLDHPVGEQPVLVLEGESEVNALDVIRAGKPSKQGRPADQLAAAVEWLKDFLFNEGHPVPANFCFEDALQNGIKRRTLRRAANAIGVVKTDASGNESKGGPKTVWSLPSELEGMLRQAAEHGSMISDASLEDLLRGDGK